MAVLVMQTVLILCLKDEVKLLNETLINRSVFPTTMATFPIDLSQFKK